MSAASDPYSVLGVTRDADDAQIHAAYRAAVRRTHPDAGGDATAFEAVQEAYEVLRDPARRRARNPAPPPHGRDAPPPPRQTARTPPVSGTPTTRMEDLLAESQRLEDELRELAGLSARHAGRTPPDEPEDSLGAILRDAARELLDAADEGARELRRRAREL